jgi:hypothetical protein
MPRALIPRLPHFYLTRGEMGRIELVADFGNGHAIDVTNSSKITYESSDTAVAPPWTRPAQSRG